MARQALNEEEREKIREKIRQGFTQMALADEYGVSQATISNTVRYGRYNEIFSKEKHMTSKKLLIIGNGFDLAHGLWTGYGNFLDFLTWFASVWTGAKTRKTFREIEGNLKKYKMHGLYDNFCKWAMGELECLYKEISDPTVRSGRSDLKKLNELMTNNVWYRYLYEVYYKSKIKGQNWVDFETEIKNVIKWMDDLEDITGDCYYGDLRVNHIAKMSYNEKISSFFKELKSVHDEETSDDKLVYEVSEVMYKDLRRLTEALSLYLTEFVMKNDAAPLDVIKKLKPDWVLSFNYTDTFERLYGMSHENICYVHGSCRESNTEGNCNLVLGIDEYLSEGERDKRNDYAIFKKFVQRIRYCDSTKYMLWADMIENDPSHTYDVYVYGHSLDVTDKEILKLFLKPENTSVHIFSRKSNEVEKGRQIQNMIRLIGEETLIKKANAVHPQFEFIDIE